MNRRSIVTIILLFCGFLLLLVLAFFSKQTAFFSWDLEITKFIQSHRSGFLDTFFWWVSWFGYPPQGNYITGAILVFLLLKRWFREAIFEFAVASLQVFVGYNFKFWVNRPRPDDQLIHVVHKGLEGGKYSFPAGHVESYVAIFGFLAIILFLKMKPTFVRKSLIIFLILLIVLVGPSRIYMGEHWTSDILGAYLVGGFVLGFVLLLYNFWAYAKEKFENRSAI